MDKETRNRVQRATQDARALLEREYTEQLEGTFDIRLDGTMATRPGSHLDAEQRVLRTKLVAAVEHLGSGGLNTNDAVAAYLRETAFTTLNRFVALKMLEARSLVQECISRGEQSSGLKEFMGLAPGLVQLPDHGYRLYIESLFDEIGREVRVLFDRRDPASLLWPRRQALVDLLAILNVPDLAEVWTEDETIGWVYQYFNSDEERRQMRAKSQAPRNSRELAVRNQFFTPRYVVEFLTDNTLGRIWYEMRKGETGLKDECRYLVRRPNEVFLAPGEKASAGSENETELSQEELLKRTVHIEHRPKKDPRDLRVLDPACGSGHFLLYAFGLLERLYEEGWKDPESPKSEITGRTLREDFNTCEQLRQAAPKLIIEQNLHGIDIDPRAVQIAVLALWLRAQKAWKSLGLKAAERPELAKCNIVTAEPMPGEAGMRQEFITRLKPRVLGQLVDAVFDKMKLAGEAGSLLKIEEEIREAVAAARKHWLEGPNSTQQLLFPDMAAPRPRQHELRFNVREITEERFWEEAEDRILKALEDYAKQADNGRAVSRRLFAEDAARGFAFIDLCRQRYDVVLMNPPFGTSTNACQNYLKHADDATYTELAVAMANRGMAFAPRGFVGAITTRTCLTLSRLSKWRHRDLIPQAAIIIDLGQGVMDNAFVEACLLVSDPHQRVPTIVIRDLSKSDEKAHKLRFDSNVSAWSLLSREDLFALPEQRVLLGAPGELFHLLRQPERRFEPQTGTVRRGFVLFDGFRFIRLFWEVPPESLGKGRTWTWYSKGGEYLRYYAPVHLVALRANNGAEMCAVNLQKHGQIAQAMQGSKYYHRPGATFTSRSQKGFAARCLPAGCITSDSAAVLSESDVSALFLVGWLNSRIVKLLIELQASFRKYEPGHIKTLPWPPALSKDVVEEVELRTSENTLLNWSLSTWLETDPHYRPCFPGTTVEEIHQVHARSYEEAATRITDNQRKVSAVVDQLYGIDTRGVDQSLFSQRFDEEAPLRQRTRVDVAKGLISWLFGLEVGRWGAGPPNGKLEEIQGFNPFREQEPLPPRAGDRSCQTDGTRHTDVVLIDDAGHVDDMAQRLWSRADAIYGGKADTLASALRVAGAGEEVEGLRNYLRESFFEDHLNIYTKSGRKAPVYWQFATPSVSYSVWLYYHCFTRDTFYKVLNDYVTPKLLHEERELTSMVQSAGPNPTASQRKEIADRESFVEELRAFREEVARIAPLWKPDLNDGVIINFAPLWRLVPHHRAWQKECKDCWDKLVAGDYDWAHLAMHLWPERAVPKCAEDRSLAIAHGLEEVFWVEGPDGKWQPRKADQAAIDQLIKKWTSPAVKDALKSLLEAPAPLSGRGAKKKGQGRVAPRRRRDRPAASSTNAAGSGADAAVIQKVKEIIGASREGATKAEVVTASGLTDSQWSAAINALMVEGVVAKTGERRGTRYSLTERGRQS